MKTVGVREAKTHLSSLLESVEAGEEIVIARGGRPVAKLVPLRPTRRRRPGRLKGKIRIHADFDSPLPDEIERLFRGEPA
jgi:prevent-host-death family protein